MQAPSFVLSATQLLRPPSTKTPFLPTNQCQTLSRSKPRRRSRPSITSSVEVPTHFNTVWYQESIVPVDVDIAAHHIRGAATPHPTDWHFVDRAHGLMAVIDCPTSPDTSRPSVYQNGRESPGEAMIAHIEKLLTGNEPLYSDMPVLDLSRILKSSMYEFGVPPGFSALIVDASTNVLRLASVGATGLLLVRNDEVVYRSYPSNASSLIDHLPRPVSKDAEMHVQYDSYAHLQAENVHVDFLELQEDDLVLAGTDGLFANLSELQMLAFVRPVPDRLDKTLAIANHTCLGSWTSDDVDFISYYLAILAANFSTAPNSPPSDLRYPFPPSPHLDDVTVLCVSCSFS